MVEAEYYGGKHVGADALKKSLRPSEAREFIIRRTQNLIAARGDVGPTHPDDMVGPKEAAAMKKPAFRREYSHRFDFRY